MGKSLVDRLVRNLGELGIAPTDVFVVLHEPPTEHWGIRGGQMASEVDLGFESKSDPATPGAVIPARQGTAPEVATRPEITNAHSGMSCW